MRSCALPAPPSSAFSSPPDKCPPLQQSWKTEYIYILYVLSHLAFLLAISFDPYEGVDKGSDRGSESGSERWSESGLDRGLETVAALVPRALPTGGCLLVVLVARPRRGWLATCSPCSCLVARGLLCLATQGIQGSGISFSCKVLKSS